MHFDGYTELSELAEGGMARLFKARQISLNRSVVIKLLSAEYLCDNDAKQLFEQESLVIAQLNHPNIIHVIDRGMNKKGRPYFVMEYIEGKDLSQLLQDKSLQTREIFKLLLQLCKGMACAHKNGIIHRDIKPANILIDQEGHVRILDFGIAWLAANGHSEEIVGTPDYMSPEQFTAPESVTHLSDIYSLGIIMYQLFTGHLPTPHLKNVADGLDKLSPNLSTLICNCLQQDINKRPQSADDIRLSLLKIMQGAHINKSQKTAAQTVVGKTKNKFVLLDVIKRDQFGEVYLFEDKTKKNLFVIKKRINTQAGFKEASMLGHINHKNLIKILGTSKNKNTFIVVMEYLSGSSLQDRLSRPYTLEKFKTIAIAICNALHYAHERKIIHGNLRPSNILYDEHNQLKITDFGFDEHYKPNPLAIDWYQCPEINRTPIQNDIFSAAAIFYHILTGSRLIYKQGRIQTNHQFNQLDKPLKNLLRNMIEKDSVFPITSFNKVASALKKINRLHSPFDRNEKITFEKAAPQHSKARLFFMLIVISGFLATSLYFYQQPDKYKQLISSIIKQLNIVKTNANKGYLKFKTHLKKNNN